jgi:hypothetical protein
LPPVHRRRAAVAAVAALAAAGLGAGAAPALASTALASTALAGTAGARPAAHAAGFRRACPVTARAGRAACMVLVRTSAAPGTRRASGPDAAPSNDGYGPASLRSAYGLPSATAGTGRTVAVVDAYDDPDAASDLAAYRSAWGLPACGAGCFAKVSENGTASPLPAAAGSTGWAIEESLDLDMVSAICPNCHILLVEAGSASITDLGTAVNTAVRLGADYVSNSYGAPESADDAAYDTAYYKHPGAAIVAAAGDSGYGVSYPAASQYVTSVGGTSLHAAANARGWTETAWGSSAGGEGTGSGCSAYDAKPAWQKDTGCRNRTSNDVAAVADPRTGVAVYDTYDQGGWLEVGGTSAASPIIASVFALAGTPAAGTYPSSYIYAHAASLYDVTSGADGTCSPAYLCTAQAGYDGPTGWGTPDGTAAFASAAAACPARQLLGNPGFETGAIAPWTSTAGVLAPADPPGVPARSGNWLAWLDGYTGAHTDTLAQTVTIPAACTSATLSFWLDIASNDPQARAYDTLTVQAVTSAGTTTLATYSNLNAGAGYVQHTLSLAADIGRQVTIRFTGTQTLAAHVTSFLDDDNAVTVS